MEIRHSKNRKWNSNPSNRKLRQKVGKKSTAEAFEVARKNAESNNALPENLVTQKSNVSLLDSAQKKRKLSSNKKNLVSSKRHKNSNKGSKIGSKNNAIEISEDNESENAAKSSNELSKKSRHQQSNNYSVGYQLDSYYGHMLLSDELRINGPTFVRSDIINFYAKYLLRNVSALTFCYIDDYHYQKFCNEGNAHSSMLLARQPIWFSPINYKNMYWQLLVVNNANESKVLIFDSH